MRFFGEPYPSRARPAAIYEGMEEVLVPVGQSCAYCQDEFTEEDQGFEMPYWDGETEISSTFWHHECHLRSTIGSVKHQKGECGCATGEFSGDDDAEFPTKHAASIAARAYFEEHRYEKAVLRKT